MGGFLGVYILRVFACLHSIGDVDTHTHSLSLARSLSLSCLPACLSASLSQVEHQRITRS